MHRLEAYITLALIFIIAITIIDLPIIIVLKKRGKSILRHFCYLGLLCSIFLIIFATILFTPITFTPETYTLNLIPFSWMNDLSSSHVFIMEKIPNILIFIPFGFIIPIVFGGLRKAYKAICVSLLFTFTIEFLQYFIGRSSDIDDIIMNLFGAIIGYLLYKGFHRIFHQSKWRKELSHH